MSRLEFNNLTLELSRLGRSLRWQRLERDWTLDHLAALTGLSKAYLSRLEAGDRQATIAALLQLSRAFGLPLASFFDEAPRLPVAAGLVSLNVGEPKPLTNSKAAVVVVAVAEVVNTALVKDPIRTAVKLSERGLEGDAQADLTQHGGAERAICVYPLEHYPFWSERLARTLDVAAFGENFSVWGMTEDAVCIGDVYRVGTATIQVSLPRGTCEKLTAHYDEPKLEGWMRATGYTGFYCRVLSAGTVRTGEPLRLLERPKDAPSVQRVNQLQRSAQ